MTKTPLIVDTGFWLALANRRDQHHARAVAALQNIVPTRRLISTWPVMTETCHLLLQRLGHPALMAFMASFSAGSFTVFELPDSQHQRLEQLMQKYRDLPMDLADASLLLLAEQLACGDILSTDQRDFQSYRWKQTQPFKNLLLS